MDFVFQIISLNYLMISIILISVNILSMDKDEIKFNKNTEFKESVSVLNEVKVNGQKQWILIYRLDVDNIKNENNIKFKNEADNGLEIINKNGYNPNNVSNCGITSMLGNLFIIFVINKVEIVQKM